MTSEPITICSASFNCEDYIKYNLKNLYRIYDNFKWVVAESQQKGSRPLEDIVDPNVSIIKGANAGLARRMRLDGNVREHQFKGIASYDHAANLNVCVCHINTRYVLFLDPDFFISQDIGRLLHRMSKGGLSSIGVGYSNNCNRKGVKLIQDIPVATCMLIDTDLIKKDLLDFRPIPLWGSPYYPDTGVRIYQRLQLCNYKCEVSKQCFIKNCKECRAIGLGGIESFGRKVEKFFIKTNGLQEAFGVHSHCHSHVSSNNNDDYALNIYNSISNLDNSPHSNLGIEK